MTKAASAAEVATRVWQNPGCRGHGSAEARAFRHTIAGDDIARVTSQGRYETVVELKGGVPFRISTTVLEQIRPDLVK